MVTRSLLALSLCLLSACGGGTSSESKDNFRITSASYTDNGVIPNTNACSSLGGNNLSPQLSLIDLPADTASVAIVMDDEVAPCGTGVNACVHWAVFNIPVTKTTIAAGENLLATSGVTYGQTYDGLSAGYAGPCPPSNHIYKLTVFALNANMPTVVQNTNVTRSSFAATYRSNILSQATWTGRYPQ